jgi:PPK2 family polyphosphate:nucleotide phosphotransferase
MKPKLPKTSKFLKSYCVEDGKDFRLKDIDPGDTQGVELKEQAHDFLDKGIARLSDLQQKLYAQDQWAVLIILQGMDAAGKDSIIRHVMSGVNPQGCEVYSFKEPSREDLDHDFLWRAAKLLPQRGRIGIFNRSYYEEVLVLRVHPELLRKERIPNSIGTTKIWKERFEDINACETHLNRNGVLLRKFFLHVSKEEQRKRFLSRLDEPEKNWKFSEADVREREHWDDYMQAYEDMIRHTATPHAPWFVVPADHKWFTRMVVAAAIIHTLEGLHLSFPRLDEAKRNELDAARELLLTRAEKNPSI